MTTANEILEHFKREHAEYYKRNPKGAIHQTIWVEREDGFSESIDCPWANPAERQVILLFLKDHFKEVGAVRYVMWCEAWLKIMPFKGDRKAAQKLADNYKQGDLATDPERKEVIFTLVVEPGGRQTMATQEIVRDFQGAVRELTPILDGPDTVNLGGALGDLLPFRTIN